MTGLGAAQRLRRSWRLARRDRSWRLARRELFGAARTVRGDLGRLERPGHARGRAAVDRAGWPYRRLVTPLVFTVLFLGAISGSYYAAAGGLFTGHRPGVGTPDLPLPADSSPVPDPSTSGVSAVTVLPSAPVPMHPAGTPGPTVTPPRGGPASGTVLPPVPCEVCPTPSVSLSASPTDAPSDSPSPSPTPSVVASS